MVEYKTMSLPVAAFAMAHGANLIRVEKVNLKHCALFLDQPTTPLGKAYFGGAEAPAEKLYEALLAVRREINAALKGGAQ